MLTKDHRMRMTLDAIVVDEWVTRESAEPVFEEGDDFADHKLELIIDKIPENDYAGYIKVS